MQTVAYRLAATPHFTKTLRMMVDTHYRWVYHFTTSEWEEIMEEVKNLRFPDEFQVGDHVRFSWVRRANVVEGVIKHISETGDYITVLPHGAEDLRRNRYVILRETCMFDD